MALDEHFVFILQDIEEIVLKYFRKNPEMTDYSVQRVYDALAAHYKADVTGRTPKTPDLDGLESRVFKSLLNRCERIIGRRQTARDLKAASEADQYDDPDDVDRPGIDSAAILACANRLRKIVSSRTKSHGRQGYVKYLDEFII